MRPPPLPGMPRRGRGPKAYVRVCPDSGEEVSYLVCARCRLFVRPMDGSGLRLCWYDEQERRTSGFYARTQDEWEGFLRELDPETYRRLQDERSNDWVDPLSTSGPTVAEMNLEGGVTEDAEREPAGAAPEATGRDKEGCGRDHAGDGARRGEDEDGGEGDRAHEDYDEDDDEYEGLEYDDW